MSDSPLSCDLPETDIEQQLEKRFYRTYGERLASPPARKVAEVSDSSEGLDHGVAYVSKRFMDIRTAFMSLRRYIIGFVGLFMMLALSLTWLIDQLYDGVFAAAALLFVPLWIAVYLFEIFVPVTLPVRIDRQGGFVYVGHRGTFYRIPWDDLEVTFSYNLQYFGSGVMWDRQYYSHIFLREKHYFCGKNPARPLLRKRISSYFKEEHLYRKWNFFVRYYVDGVKPEDNENLYAVNYDSYNRHVVGEPGRRFFGHIIFIIFMPSIIWWKLSPFKYKWPKEIEDIFGKVNYY